MSRGRLIARACCACVTFGLLVAGLPPSVSAQLAPLYTGSQVSDRAAGHRIDEWGGRITAVPRCLTERDSDCVVGLRVKTGDRWQSAVFKDAYVESTGGEGFEPGKIMVATWEYQSAAEGLVGVTMWSVMYPRGVTYRGKDYLLHGLEVFLQRNGRSPYSDPLNGVPFDCSLGTVDNCLLGPRLPPNDLFEITARTSWLRDNGVSIDGMDWKVSPKKVPTGFEWTLTARQALVSAPAKWKDDVPAAGWQPSLRFLLAHAGEGLHDSAFDPQCADFGAPWQANNTPGGGRLHWVKSKQTLDFEVHAPHLNPYGKPLEGDFSAQIPLAWLRCFAGKKLNPAYFTVSVVNEDGNEQVATTSLRVRKGVVFVRATGFHFSSPTIQLSTKKPKR